MQGIVAALAVALLLAACATRPEDAADYPSSLSRPARSSGECPTISGVYGSAGSRLNPDGSRDPANLISDVLHLGDDLSREAELRLTLTTKLTGTLGGLFGQSTAARLKVEGRSGLQWEEARWDQSLCMQGMLVFPVSRQQSGVGGVPGLILSHGEVAYLFGAEDGSLVAIRTVVDAGIAVVIPWYRRRSTYFVFPRVTSK